MKKLTKDFNAVSVQPGEIFAIEMPPSAGGYLWLPEVVSGGAAFLGEQSSDLTNRNVGAHQQIFLFRADAAGDAEIAISLKRPWETDLLKTEKFHIKIK